MIEVTTFPVSTIETIMLVIAIVTGIVFLIFLAAVHERGVEAAAGLPGIAMCSALLAMIIVTVVWIIGTGFVRDSTSKTLESAHGIEQLECRNADCTWIADGEPGAGTLVQRDNMAGLLDANQKPLPLKRSAQ